MEPILRIIYILSGTFAFTMLVLIVWLFKHEKLRKNEFFLWLCISVALLIVSAMPSILAIVGSILGIAYTYTAVVVIGFPLFLSMILYLFIQLSNLNGLLVKLAQRMAILEHYLPHSNDEKKAKEP